MNTQTPLALRIRLDDTLTVPLLTLFLDGRQWIYANPALYEHLDAALVDLLWDSTMIALDGPRRPPGPSAKIIHMSRLIKAREARRELESVLARRRHVVGSGSYAALDDRE